MVQRIYFQMKLKSKCFDIALKFVDMVAEELYNGLLENYPNVTSRLHPYFL